MVSSVPNSDRSVMTLTFAPTVPRVRISRKITAFAVGECGPTACEWASLVVSELVSNAVRHAVNTVTVTVSVTSDMVHLAVEDDGAGNPVMGAFEPVGRAGGRGLRVVDTVSDSWGVASGHGTKTVWAQLARVAAA
jgi:two-component sensor histidine kinase